MPDRGCIRDIMVTAVRIRSPCPMSGQTRGAAPGLRLHSGPLDGICVATSPISVGDRHDWIAPGSACRRASSYEGAGVHGRRGDHAHDRDRGQRRHLRVRPRDPAAPPPLPAARPHHPHLRDRSRAEGRLVRGLTCQRTGLDRAQPYAPVGWAGQNLGVRMEPRRQDGQRARGHRHTRRLRRAWGPC